MSGWINLGFPPLIFRVRMSLERAKRGEWAGFEAVIFSAMAAEAFLNDFAEMADFLSQPENLPEVRAAREIILGLERQRAGVRRKYRSVYKSLYGQDLPTTEPWWCDYDLLVNLRNELVHAKVDIAAPDYPERVQTLVAELEKRHLVKWGPPSDWRIALDEWEKPSAWAFETVKTLVTIILNGVPPCRFRDSYVEPILGPHSTLNMPIEFTSD